MIVLLMAKVKKNGLAARGTIINLNLNLNKYGNS